MMANKISMKRIFGKCFGIFSLGMLLLSVSAKADGIREESLQDHHGNAISNFELAANRDWVERDHDGHDGGFTKPAHDPILEDVSGKPKTQQIDSYDGDSADKDSHDRDSDSLPGKSHDSDGEGHTITTPGGDPVSTPEPASSLLLGVGLVAVGMLFVKRPQAA